MLRFYSLANIENYMKKSLASMTTGKIQEWFKKFIDKKIGSLTFKNKGY
jgi:hypothetical protein